MPRDGFCIALEHGGPHDDPMRNLKNLSEEFADILPCEHCLRADDRGVPMAKNIVFELIVLELIGARFESRVAQDTVQVEHNVQLFPPWRRHDRTLDSGPNLFPPLRCYLNKTRQRRIGVTWLNAEVGEPVSGEMH